MVGSINLFSPSISNIHYISNETFNFQEFLGRTEIRVSDIVGGCEDRRGPVTRTLKLLEAESGVISVKLDIQLF